MRRSKTQNISEVISELMKRNGFEDKLAEVRIIRSWEELLGKTVSRYTKKLYIKDKTLYVYLNSSVVKSEIMLMRDDLIIKLNEKAGKQTIERIIFK